MTKQLLKFIFALATIVCCSLLAAVCAGALVHAAWAFLGAVVQLFLLGWDLVGGFKH